jgi:hypothetical protein
MKHYLKRCARRCKGFAIRFSILGLAVLAILLVMLETGEVVPFSLAVERLTEAFGAALADTVADV